MSKPLRGRAIRSTVALLVGALVLTGCSDFDGAYDLPLPGSPVDADEAFEITADFRDVVNVVPRSPVMVDDVVVGEVTEVDRVGWNARLTMNIREDVVLPDNAVADIQQVSLLGEKYVALEAPAKKVSADQLGEGDHIGLADTGRNPELEEVLGALSFLLSGGGVAQLGTITREANLVMSGRQDRLRALMSSLDGVVSTIDEQKGDVIRAMESMNNLAVTLNAEKDVIADALDAAGPAVEVLHDQQEEMVELLGALEDLGRVGTRVIEASKDDVLSILEDLEPVLRKLREADDKLMPGLNLMVSFPFPEAANNIIQGDYADTITKVQIDFENLYRTLGLPDLQLKDPTELIDHVAECLASGSLSSTECAIVLQDLDLLKDLQRQCKSLGSSNPICEVVLSVSSLEDLLGGVVVGDGGALGFLGTSLTRSQEAPPTSRTALMGAVA